MSLFRTADGKKMEQIPSLEGEVTEAEVESILEANPTILESGKLMLIGKQIETDTGKRLDLLAMDEGGRLVLAELKRGIAPREVIAQIIDYSVWVRGLSEKTLEDFFRSYRERALLKASTLHAEYEATFGKELSRRSDNEVLMVLFAKDFPIEVIRTAEFMSEKGIPIRCIAYEMYHDSSGKLSYLSTRDVAGQFDALGTGDGSLGIEPNAKTMAKRLAKQLEVSYGKSLESTKYPRRGAFRTFQQRDGSYISSYCDWKYEEGILCFEIQLHANTVYLLFWDKGKSELYDKKMSQAPLIALFKKNGFTLIVEKDEPPYYQIDLGEIGRFDDMLIARIIGVFRDRCLPILECYLGES